ncbi:MAG: hypothetical protein J0H48_04940 [Nitrosospira multiformis]|nr:hypothetical protein [Nitrosospira multiformis]
MERKHRGDAFAAIHETMEALHEIGTVEKQTMRKFEVPSCSRAGYVTRGNSCATRARTPVATRLRPYLNVSKNLISDWERGVKKPSGPALRLLTMIKKNGIQAIA